MDKLTHLVYLCYSRRRHDKENWAVLEVPQVHAKTDETPFVPFLQTISVA